MCFEQILEAAPDQTVAIRQCIFHLVKHRKKYKLDMVGNAGKVRTNKQATFSYELLHMG